MSAPSLAAGPSSEPATPGCALFGLCGGCQLQDLPYPDQLALKTEEVQRLFGALAAEVRACAASPAPYGYRSKLTPHFARPRPDRPLAIGFLRAGMPRRTIDVERCAIATPTVNERLAALRADVHARRDSYRRGATLLVRDAASGVTVDPRAVITEKVGALELQFLASDFFQNNPFLLPALVEHVAREASAGGARFLVDAYCGSGLLGLAAAPAFEQVLGVEVSASAVNWARANADRNGRTNCAFVAADASAVFATVPFSAAETAVIVDPPRKGCSDEFLRQLVAFAPRTIVYVSCNPETQALDAAMLAAAGYACLRVQPFDMFPQTRHVESVAVFERR
jgi:23S rRNA (uracil1939-C5)-methyltransferase/tRNA (uracil-5-)-methyltransferase